MKRVTERNMKVEINRKFLKFFSEVLLRSSSTIVSSTISVNNTSIAMPIATSFALITSKFILITNEDISRRRR